MDSPTRLVTAVAVLALLAGGTALVLHSTDGGSGASAEYQVTIDGPDGPLYNGTVHVDDATAHTALLAAADAGHLAVEVVEHPGYRPCGTYVRAIGGHAEGDEPGGGWVYEVHRDGAWTRPAVGACAFALQEGDAVRWMYVVS